MTAWSSDPAGTNAEDDPADRSLPRPYWYAVVAPWEPGAAEELGLANLEARLDGRVASVMGQLGVAMGSEFAGMFDLSESYEEIPTEGMPRDQDGTLTIWVSDSMLSCRASDLR